MSNRLFQGVIHQMSATIDRKIGVTDENGVVIACSELSRIGEVAEHVRDELAYTTEATVISGYTYCPLGNAANAEYVVFVEGSDVMAGRYCSLLSISLQNIKALYDEKYDKSSFIKNIIMDNILPSDIYAKGKELHFNTDEARVVFLIRFYSVSEMRPFDIIQSIFPDKSKDYVISIGDTDIALVRQAREDMDSKELESIAKSIVDTVSSEFFCKIGIGIGTVVTGLKNLARSYKEAQVAIEVGKVFETEKNIISYENLGIGRLIYQLPTTLCEMFLSEIFKHGSLESLDAETLQTIQAFFENNLNVSETARKLFVHRNTLVYRLDKIHKMTGLDLRVFDHAITFKVALMVKRYLTSKPAKY